MIFALKGLYGRHLGPFGATEILGGPDKPGHGNRFVVQRRRATRYAASCPRTLARRTSMGARPLSDLKCQ